MNIAILSNSEAWGGLEMNTFRLAQWLKNEGHQTSIVCPENSRILEESQKTGLTLISFSKKTLKRGNILGAHKIYKKLRKEKIERIIIGHSRDINLGVFLKIFSRSKIKVVYLQQMRIGVNKKDFLHTFFYKKLDAWIAPLPYLKKNVLEHTQIKADKIHIIPLCIKIEAFTQPKSQSDARKKFDLPKEVKIAGIIGRIDPQKGQAYLIEALAAVRKKGMDLHILLMGEETKGEEGQYLPQLKELVSKFELENFVHFRPYTNDTALAFASLDIFVMASWQETFGMVTIEAMASKLAVIGTNTYGTKDLIQDKKTGLYCLPKDAQSIAEGLEFLLKNPKKAQEMAEKAQTEVIQKYSHRVEVQAILTLLANL